MSCPAIEYVRPATLAEALDLLQDPGRRALAGGQSLIPALKGPLRTTPQRLVDIGRLTELQALREQDGGLVIGANTRHFQLAGSTLLGQLAPALAQAARAIADVQVRNMGTLGGSLAHGDPGADLPAALLALRATIHIAHARGRREATAQQFFVEGLKSGELVVAVKVPGCPHSAYLKVGHPATHYALCGVAAAHSAQGWCLGITGVARRPYSFSLTTLEVSDLTEGVELQSDLYASGEYRAHLCRVQAARAMELALPSK